MNNERRGNNLVVIILVILVALLLGYIVYDKFLSNPTGGSEPKSTEVKYEATKTIELGGKANTIGLLVKNKKMEKKEDNLSLVSGVAEVYLNDTKIKAASFEFYAVDASTDITMKVEKLNDDNFVVALNTGIYFNNSLTFYVFNKDGLYIGEASWNGATGIVEKSTGKTVTYEISDGNIYIYSVIYGSESEYVAKKTKYSVLNDTFVEEVVKNYKQSEVELTGK